MFPLHPSSIFFSCKACKTYPIYPWSVGDHIHETPGGTGLQLSVIQCPCNEWISDKAWGCAPRQSNRLILKSATDSNGLHCLLKTSQWFEDRAENLNKRKRHALSQLWFFYIVHLNEVHCVYTMYLLAWCVKFNRIGLSKLDRTVELW